MRLHLGVRRFYHWDVHSSRWHDSVVPYAMSTAWIVVWEARVGLRLCRLTFASTIELSRIYSH